MTKIQGVSFIQGDFLKENTKEEIFKKLGEKADILISDMAANTTGNKSLDCIRTNALCIDVINFAQFALKTNGVLVSKLFVGQDFIEIKNLAKKKFKKVDFFKPDSCRAESRETYIHCKGFRSL